MWMAFLEKEEERTTKEDYYFGNVCAEIRRQYAKHPHKVQWEDFIPKIVKKAIKPVKSTMEFSKKCWFAAMGLEYEKEIKKENKL